MNLESRDHLQPMADARVSWGGRLSSSTDDGDIGSEAGGCDTEDGVPAHLRLQERPRSLSTPATVDSVAASSGKLKSKARAAWNNLANGE